MVEYAYDIALVVVAKYLEDSELYSHEAIKAINAHLESETEICGGNVGSGPYLQPK